MKRKELEEIKLREEIVKYKGMKNWNKARNIWEEERCWDEWSWLQRIFCKHHDDKEIKKIYDKLMDQEFAELKKGKKK